MVQRLPCCAGFVQVFGFQTGTHLMRYLIELDMDAVPLAMGVGTQFLLRRQRHLCGAMALAHGYLLVGTPAPG